jgi:hypothetical protein
LIFKQLFVLQLREYEDHETSNLGGLSIV